MTRKRFSGAFVVAGDMVHWANIRDDARSFRDKLPAMSCLRDQDRRGWWRTTQPPTCLWCMASWLRG